MSAPLPHEAIGAGAPLMARLAAGVPSLAGHVDPASERPQALARALGAARDPLAEVACDGTSEAGVQVWRHPIPGAVA